MLFPALLGSWFTALLSPSLLIATFCDPTTVFMHSHCSHLPPVLSARLLSGVNSLLSSSSRRPASAPAAGGWSYHICKLALPSGHHLPHFHSHRILPSPCKGQLTLSSGTPLSVSACSIPVQLVSQKERLLFAWSCVCKL